VAKYENDLEEALIQSAIAGGDNASRGLAIGMILGAHLGATALPDRWVSKLKQKDRILELLDQC
jgi:ADP-ribosylglycohydrolase